MPLTPPADAAIFDFDGVIIDSLRARRDGHQRHAPGTRLPAAAGRRARTLHRPSHAEGVRRADGSQPRARRPSPAYVATYHEQFERVYLEQTRLVDGIAEVLRGLTIPLGLATAKERRFVGPLLDRFGLEFDVISAPELAEPKSETVARALESLGARDAVVVGDRVYDVDAARANGLRVIGVTWGIGDRDELRGADLVVERPAELASLLG